MCYNTYYVYVCTHVPMYIYIVECIVREPVSIHRSYTAGVPPPPPTAQPRKGLPPPPLITRLERSGMCSIFHAAW